MTSSKLARLTGWMILLGPLVDVIMVIIKPGNFLTEHPDGPTGAMRDAVADIADQSGVAHFSVEVGLFASLLFLLGTFGVERLLRDGSWGEYLRKVGFLLFLIAYGLRAASYASGHLVANILTHGMEGASGSMNAADSALLVVGLEGTLSIFSTILLAVAVGLFGLSLMNASLIGGDKVVAILLAIIPAVGVVVFMLFGAHVHDNIFAVFLVGNILALVQVIWTTLLGVALIRKADAFPTLS